MLTVVLSLVGTEGFQHAFSSCCVLLPQRACVLRKGQANLLGGWQHFLCTWLGPFVHGRKHRTWHAVGTQSPQGARLAAESLPTELLQPLSWLIPPEQESPFLCLAQL